MELIAIGVIHSPYNKKEEAPRQGRLSNEGAILEIYPEFEEGLQDIEDKRHIIVLYWAHLGQRDVLKTVTPFGPEIKGVFATRSPSRPNPIIFCIADLIKVEGNKLYVSGIDAIDGSPILDIKPYVYELDNIPHPEDTLDRVERGKIDRELWEKCIVFHGHECPGLAIGFRACEAVKEKLGVTFSKDEEIVCVTETDACGVDAIQVITGCTLGKGNLIYRDRGKQAFSFFVRSTGESIRIVLKPNNKEMTREERKAYLLEAAIDELFEFKKPHFELPERARIFNSIICEICGESAAEHKIRIAEGKKVCLDCFKEYSRGW